MAKYFTMFLPPLLLLLLSSLALSIAHASTYRTTVTTTVDVQETSSRCREQIERQDLRSCERYLTERRGSNHPLIRRVVLQSDPAERCCRQLNEMDDDCQCEAMKQILREQWEKEEDEEKLKLMMRRAWELSSRCGVETGCWQVEEAVAVVRKNARSCREEIEREDLRECEGHLREGIMMGGNTHHLKGCCRRLRRLDERCQCEGIEEVVRRQLEQLEGEEEEAKKVLQRARELPDACNLRTRCEF